MIGISKLYCGTVEASDPLRYGRLSQKLPSHLLQFSMDKTPVVVWNVTRRCNLRCAHCYSRSTDACASEELSREEGMALIDDLAQMGCPVLLLSGGEPLARPDVTELCEHARQSGLRVVLSTNGTLLKGDIPMRLRDAGVSYVGISLDGLRDCHDRFRGVRGAFDAAMEGLRHCRDQGLKVGLRFTIHRGNASEVPKIFDLVERERIPRVCFYHLVYSGRGTGLMQEDLTHEEARGVVDLIMDKTKEAHLRGNAVEVLTVDNHADGPYLYLRLLREDPRRATEVLELLRMNQGNSSGHGIGCVSWDGEVHADQFWRHRSFGNVRVRPFSEIWTHPSDPLLLALKNKRPHLKGRCAVCRWVDICGGNLRVRAEAVTGDVWAPDPACYLTEEEISQEASLGS
ncbi:MAG: 12,18-didecarboxysiroheme deacetylase [Thermodesulfobacteriota bacterium]